MMKTDMNAGEDVEERHEHSLYDEEHNLYDLGFRVSLSIIFTLK
jgi:hypothetical protein